MPSVVFDDPVDRTRLLAGLVVLAIAVWAVSLPVQRRWTRAWLSYSENYSLETKASWKNAVLSSGLLSLIALLLVALGAQDYRFGSGRVAVRPSNLQLVFLVDRSRSMLARDFRGSDSRLEIAQTIVRRILAEFPSSPAALMTFAGDGRLETALTRDHQVLRDKLMRIQPQDNPLFGSLIGSGLDEAESLFASQLRGEKLLVVLSDAEVEDTQAVAENRTSQPRHGFCWITVGDDQAGSDLQIPEINPGPGDKRTIQTKAQPVRFESLARSTSGLALHASIDKQGIAVGNEVIATIRRELPPPAAEKNFVRLGTPLYPYFAFAALMMLCTPLFVTERTAVLPRFLRRRLMIGTVVAWSALTLGADGLKEGRDGASEQGRAVSQTIRERTVQYNAAVRAYRQGNYLVAAQHFSSLVTDSDPQIRQRATFNLANSLYQATLRGGTTKTRAINSLNRAAALYRSCIATRHRPDDAGYNLRLTELLIEKIRSMESKTSDRSSANDDSRDDEPDRQKSATSPPPASPPADDKNQPSGDEKPDTRSQQDRSDPSDRAGSEGTGSEGTGSAGTGSAGDRRTGNPFDESQARETLARLREDATRRSERTGLPSGDDRAGHVSPFATKPW